MLDNRVHTVAALSRLAAKQAGLVSRTQVLDLGLTDAWLRHQLDARRFRRVHPGVYATYTGALS